MNNKNTSAGNSREITTADRASEQDLNAARVRLILFHAVSDALNSTLAIDLCPLHWSIERDGTWTGAFPGTDSEDKAERAVQDWANRYGLTRASAQDTTPGTTDYRGTIVGRRVELWAITNRTEFDSACGR